MENFNQMININPNGMPITNNMAAQNNNYDRYQQQDHQNTEA